LNVSTKLVALPSWKGRNVAETIRKIQNEVPPSPTKFQLSIPPLFEGVILKILAKNCDDRFASPTLWLKELKRMAKLQGLMDM
jgi:hypothetical protein